MSETRAAERKTKMTRVFSYGTVPARVAPVIGEEEAFCQLQLANRLWNTLTAIYRTSSEVYRRIMHDDAQEEITRIKAEMTEVREQIKAQRAKARSRAVDAEGLKDRLKVLREDISARIEQQKATSKERHDKKKAELSQLNERTKHRIKRARQAAASMGLFWGTYNDIVQRAEVASKKGELHFRRFIGDGTLTAQIVGGAKTERCIGGRHSFFQVSAPENGGKWRYARMRIGSTEDRTPIWLKIPIVYHRDIPENADIKSVSMTKRSGQWQLNVTVNEPSAPAKTGSRTVAIDIGWRVMPEGVRVAFWKNSEGEAGEVIVSKYDLSQFEKIRSLRSLCDQSRDEFLPVLVEWLKGRELNDEWKTKTAFIHQWKSMDRLVALIRWWFDNRLENDEEILLASTEWRRRYLHLSNWWRNLEDQMRRRLQERYRVFAVHIANNYDIVYLEEFDLRNVVEKPEAESDKITTAASRYRQMVSPSVLRQCLISACGREGTNLHKLSAEYTTQHCHVCGCKAKWDQAGSVMHRCEECGTIWDQDYNAACNLLMRGASGQVASTASQQVRERKWDRVRNLSQAGSKMTENNGTI